jgi:hypothetical protein
VEAAGAGVKFVREINSIPEGMEKRNTNFCVVYSFFVLQESTWTNYGSVSSRVVKSDNGGGAVGDTPTIDNEIRFRGKTRDGRDLTAADFVDAEMSLKFAGKVCLLLFVFLVVCWFVGWLVCLFVCLLVCLFVCLFVY